MTKYLHTMIRVSSLEDSIAFFEVLSLREIRPARTKRAATPTCSSPHPATKRPAALELTYNWDPSLLHRRPLFWAPRLRCGQHLRHLQRLHRPRRPDQPPAA